MSSSECEVPRRLGHSEKDDEEKDGDTTAHVPVSSRMDSAYHHIRKLSAIYSTFENSQRALVGERESLQPCSPHRGSLRMHQFKENGGLAKYSSKRTPKIASGVVLVSHPLAEKHNKRALVLVLNQNEHGTYG